MSANKQPWDISYTDAAALARTAGLRNAGDRVRSALANGVIEGDRRGATMWTMRAKFDRWLESALAEDRADDDLMLRIDQARAVASAAGIKSASARVMSAVVNGEIDGCFKDNSGWFIPKDRFESWLEVVRAESEIGADTGFLSLQEATALASAYGLSGMRSFILTDCIEGRIPGAYRDGSSWRIPVASMKTWITDLNTAVDEICEPGGQSKPSSGWWSALLMISAAILLWFWVLSLCSR